jgi:hypothetical protein
VFVAMLFLHKSPTYVVLYVVVSLEWPPGTARWNEEVCIALSALYQKFGNKYSDFFWAVIFK